ncbi:large-conductance mechanosensitive channel [Gottschalkia acidurici 9a]|uniref:Large-conductance mechanosensitive channel n=1 Tax=Gottschalkia acidurici (strain ATCC 7906 / DSM 604 / BCRC 14475 / CIP 104303 / KCTC 5404 / NCIMB 10678 / 9a) TaxID=1128398 RepID=K0B2S1_GOTA9|nr:large conductance mechanosensitive channel protein MscL [Gottschalkia acidurici]AFS79422.1 large-conductance mechanosensitive channel [Gottschalkia acidurici 9a]
MLKEFKEFALRGSIVDLAIGVIIGGAFGKIVTSLVNDVIMPIIGLLLGKVDFSNLFIAFGDKSYSTLEEAKKAGAATLNYGTFINNVVDFIIISFCIFIMVKQLSRFSKKKDEVEDATTKKCPYCITDIAKEATKCPNCTSNLEQTSNMEV